MSGSRQLEGLSVLVLEDNFYIADESKRTLEKAGARVLGPCSDLADTLEALQAERPDCALVDVNLGDGPTFAPARALAAAGVQIVLMTGYDAAIIPADLKDTLCLQKPVAAHRLVSGVALACHR